MRCNKLNLSSFSTLTTGITGLLIAGIIFLISSCGNRQETERPVIKPLMEAVYASGYVVANNEYQITAQVDGYLSEVFVLEGELIKKGTPLFSIESSQQNARSAIARETFLLAKKNDQSGSPVLAELEAAIASSKTKLSFDSINYIRYKNLMQQRATTQIDLDRMKLAYENSRNEYRLQTSRLAKTKNQLRLDHENAQKQLQIANEESGRYVVKSEIDGKLFTTSKEKNELVRRGEVIAVAGDADHFYLRLAVDEMDVKKMATGQEVMVKIDAFGDKLFKASIDRIYPIINIKEQSIRVDALFTEMDEKLYSGLAIEANIVIQQKQKAMVIPKKYLTTGDSVAVLRDGNEVKVKVMTGIKTLDEIEIISGLNTTDQLMQIK